MTSAAKYINLMFRIIIIVSTILFLTGNVFAQDYIYKKNQEQRIAASNVEISTHETTYKAFGDSSGKVIPIPNSQISMITFENGEVKFFENKEKVTSRYNYKKNIINYHLFDLIVNNFKISYERIISNGKIGIQIPIAFGYGNGNSGFDDIRNNFYTGISVNFYPTGQGKVRYLMGPGIQIGTGYYNGGSSYPSGQTTKNIFVTRFLINNGVMFTPIEALSISLVGSIGIRIDNKNAQSDNEKVKTVGAFSANLSYRF